MRDIGGAKLSKTPFWAIDLSNILNRYLKEDGRIPEKQIRFFVHERDDGKPEVLVVKNEWTLSDQKYHEYYDVASEIFEKCKDDAISELNRASP